MADHKHIVKANAYSIPGHKLNPIDNKLLKIIHENLTDEENGLSETERQRLNHLRVHVEHMGHDEMHAEMVLILFFVTVVAQMILMFWKKRNFRSYQQVSMFGVWLAPFLICVNLKWWYFVFWWSLYTLVTGWVVKTALQRPLKPNTPRQVYKWFLAIHKTCSFLSISGYVVIMVTLLGFPALLLMKPAFLFDWAVSFVFYGIYFGVLSRDLADVCSDKMAAHIGYYKPEGMPTRTLETGICAICGNAQFVGVGEEGIIEDTLRLGCGHTFHEFCIRGWCIVGKKHTCPYCKEKVDLNTIIGNNYWEKPHVLFGQTIDWVRLMVAWQPLVIILVQSINKWLNLK